MKTREPAKAEAVAVEKRLHPVVFPRDAVLDVEQLAAALGIGPRKVETLDLPSVYLGARQRWVWAQVLDTLAKRASGSGA